MSMSDPIADLLTRIRNACQAYHEEVSIPASKVKVRIAEIMKDEGYIEDCTLVPDRLQGVLVVKLRYGEDGRSVIRGLQRESRPSRRIYVDSENLPKVLNGLGITILSTSKGVLAGSTCRKMGVGGEVLCNIW